MNAHKFVEQYGLDKAKEVVECVPDSATHFNHNFLGGHYAKEVMRKKQSQWAWFNTIDRTWYYDFAEHNHFAIYELKQAIADFELIEKVGGLDVAKKQVKQAHEQGYLTISVWMKIKKENKEYEGFGCLYIDKLEAAVKRIEEGLRDEL